MGTRSSFRFAALACLCAPRTGSTEAASRLVLVARKPTRQGGAHLRLDIGRGVRQVHFKLKVHPVGPPSAT